MTRESLLRGWRERPPVPGVPEGVYPQNEEEFTALMAQRVAIGGAVHALPDGSFLYSQAAPHEIVLFDLSSTPEDGWFPHPVVAMPRLLEAPLLKAVDYSIEDGQPTWGFHTMWPQSAGVFELDNGHILNIVLMEAEGRSLWQVFDPSRDADGIGAAIVAEVSVDRAYKPLSLCDNGDVLASVEDPVTGINDAVRLRLDWSRAL